MVNVEREDTLLQEIMRVHTQPGRIDIDRPRRRQHEPVQSIENEADQKENGGNRGVNFVAQSEPFSMRLELARHFSLSAVDLTTGKHQPRSL